MNNKDTHDAVNFTANKVNKQAKGDIADALVILGAAALQLGRFHKLDDAKTMEVLNHSMAKLSASNPETVETKVH